MIRSRQLLHLAAFFAPAVIAATALLLITVDDAAGLGRLTLAAILAAQVAAALAWLLLRRKSCRWPGRLVAGLLMALVTHGLFALLVFLIAIEPHGSVADVLGMAAAVGGLSLIMVGYVSLPVTLLVAWVVGHQRQKELLHVRA